ncbi:hypothetical protein MRX96_032662 [Rhipicephalus microplus]
MPAVSRRGSPAVGLPAHDKSARHATFACSARRDVATRRGAVCRGRLRSQTTSWRRRRRPVQADAGRI